MIQLRILFFVMLACLLVSSCSKKKETCTDGIQNQNETKVDCGGPCSPCGTCSDGVLNQNETNVDCGGVCSKCPSCTDNIQNQGETGIDCGGPCGSCPILYPSSGIYGVNLLRKDTVVAAPGPGNFSTGPYFSLRAELSLSTSLKVIVNVLSLNNSGSFSGPYYYDVNTNRGWAVSAYDQTAKTQTFIADGQVVCDVDIQFINSGSLRMDIYENGAAMPTRVKYINW